MRIYDDIFAWEGWGGKLRLGSGACRLRIYDMKQRGTHGLAHLRPMIVVVTDLAGSPMSVRSCAGHIATSIVRQFGINPHRMLYVEYYAPKRYGEHHEHLIPERFDVVDFTWHEDQAIKPIWRAAPPPMVDTLKELLPAAPFSGNPK